MAPPAEMGSVASLDSPGRRAMASKAPQETLVPQEHPEPRAPQERRAPQAWACQAARASRVSQGMRGCPGPEASLALLAPQAALQRQTVTRV